jgi:gas vesicle protein
MAKNHQENSSKNILLGLIGGSIVGAIAAVVVNSPKTQEFKEHLVDAFNNASQKVTGAVHTLGESSSQGISERLFHRNQHPSYNRNLTIGAIAGGIIGLSAILFLSSDSGKGIRKQIIHSIDVIREKAHPFEDIAHIAAEHFGTNIAPWMKKVESFLSAINENEYIQHKKYRESPIFDKIIDWAVTAAKTYEGFKK